MENISELDAFLHPQLIPSGVRLILAQRARQLGEEEIFRNDPISYWKREAIQTLQGVLLDFSFLKAIEQLPDEERLKLEKQVRINDSPELFKTRDEMEKEDFLRLAEQRLPLLEILEEDQKGILFTNEDDF